MKHSDETEGNASEIEDALEDEFSNERIAAMMQPIEEFSTDTPKQIERIRQWIEDPGQVIDGITVQLNSILKHVDQEVDPSDLSPIWTFQSSFRNTLPQVIWPVQLCIEADAIEHFLRWLPSEIAVPLTSEQVKNVSSAVKDCNGDAFGLAVGTLLEALRNTRTILSINRDKIAAHNAKPDPIVLADQCSSGVFWGREYTFTKSQRPIINELVKCYRDGLPGMSEKELKDAAADWDKDSPDEQAGIRDRFRPGGKNHPIREDGILNNRGIGKGMWYLKPPPDTPAE